ncbi:uncharacterized protein LOC113215499 [Frankliniella occidentalis]|uniref:Uncharacterized protein LOC113215499 n=1 Tax=Frankliniella occidentalis TaxID=133901 RepID=A0A9C6XT18_FRAOC|nr:uncharacterized protein LOC113215499 [Frankliniella occidentalis]
MFGINSFRNAASSQPGDEDDTCSTSSSDSDMEFGNKYTKYGWRANCAPTAVELENLLCRMNPGIIRLGGSAAPRRSSSSSDSSDESEETSTDGRIQQELEDPVESEDGVKIVFKHKCNKHPEAFIAAITKAKKIKSLSLMPLGLGMSCTSTNTDKVERVLQALEAGTSDVLELELLDADWAHSLDGSDRLVRLLKKYSDSLRSVHLTSRLLVQPNRKDKKWTVLKVLSRMPHLERLQIYYCAPNLYFDTYRGEFKPTEDLRSPKRPAFPALKEIELGLSIYWFRQQFLYAMLPLHDSSITDHEYEDICGGDREEEKEAMLSDILHYKADIITGLKMACFGETTYRLPILDLFAELPNLREIYLKVEHVDVTENLKTLEQVTLLFVEPKKSVVSDAVAVIARSAAWAALRSLLLEVPVQVVKKVASDWNRVLAAVAAQCTELRKLVVAGKGWDKPTLFSLLQNNVNHIEQVDVSACDQLLPEHLALLRDAPALRSIKLRRHEQAAAASRPAQQGHRKKRGGKKNKKKPRAAAAPAAPAAPVPLEDTLGPAEKACHEAWKGRGVDVQWL